MFRRLHHKDEGENKMRSVIVVVLLVTALLTSGGAASAQGQADEVCKLAWADAWSYANALAVMDAFERLYQGHASILVEAEQKVSDGAVDSSLRHEFEALPGIRGWLWANLTDFQSSDSSLKKDVVTEFLFNRQESSAKKYESPMMQRKVNEQVHFIRMHFPSASYDLMVHYVAGKPNLPPRGLIALILDQEWLVRRIPSEMDSLAHESLQLLFWAPSAGNSFVQQSLGIIDRGDTLWWSGSKDVKVTNVQDLSPFPEIKIHSFVRKL
jgi:hypothetical protein